MNSPLLQLTLARFREFLREPEAIFWTFIFPILLAAGLGLAFRSRPAETSRVGVLNSTHQAQTLKVALSQDPALAVELLDEAGAASALQAGRIALLVVPSSDKSAEFRYDTNRPEARVARLQVDQALQRAAGRQDPVVVKDSLVNERGSRYIDFVLPGLLAMNLMGGGIWGLGFGIVDSRRKKLLKRLAVTPMSRSQYLASYLLHRLVVMVFEVAVVLAFGTLVFGVPMRGSVVALTAICLLGTLMFGALGLLCAPRVRTIEGASGIMNVVMLPMWVCSGVFFAATNFPDAIQPMVQALPLTAAVDALRLNMLQGAGFAALSGELAIMALWTALSFGLALKLFRWQ